jgi:hypothetical protein
MAKITLKVDGKELKYFDSFSFSTAIDAGCSSISFRSFMDIETFGYIKIEAYRNDVLIFTGEIINKTIPNSSPPQPFTYKAESLTHILFESTLPTDAYPLQLENSTLKDILEYICKFFEVTVLFDQSASSEASGTYKLADLGLGKTAGEIINDLVTQLGLILSHDSEGQLVITKKIEQSEITLPMYTTNDKSFDLKKFFHNYIALGQAPISDDADIQAIAVFDNIDTRRNTTQIQDSGGVDTVEKKAIGMRADSLKSIQQSLSFNNFFCNIGDFIMIDDLKLIVNQLDYSFNATGEVASISVIDANAYTRE